MAPTTEDRSLDRCLAPVPDETSITSLPVEGTLPPALSGQYLRIGPNPIARDAVAAGRPGGDAMVHSVALRAGRAVSYRNRWVKTDATSVRLGIEPVPGPRSSGSDLVGTSVLAFGDRILALGNGVLPYELTADLETVRRVDLAGGARGVGAFPRLDPVSGELHLLSFAGDGGCLVDVVSPGGLTRTSRIIGDAPGPVHDLALTRDHHVLLGDGFAGVVGRAAGARTSWMATSASAGIRSVAAYDDGATTVVHLTGPVLERWVLDRSSGTARRTVIDQAPQGFGRLNERLLGSPHRYLYTITQGAGRTPNRSVAAKHDLLTGERHDHDFGADRHPGELVYVPDPGRAGAEDGGWLVGLVHHLGRDDTSLVVLDAQHLGRAAVASVRIPRRIPFGLHGTWIPGLT